MRRDLIERYRDRLHGVLSCYDRIVVTGTLPQACYAEGMTAFLKAQGVRIFDRVEGGVNVNGEQKPVVDVEALLVGRALCPGLRMAGAQQGAIADRAASAPIVFEGGAEDVLADPLFRDALDLGALGHGPGLLAVGRKRRIRQSPDENPLSGLRAVNSTVREWAQG